MPCFIFICHNNGNLKLNIYFLGDYEFTKDKASKLGGV